jgi:protein gp37
MAENTEISWTNHSANFWWGCFKVSPGCQNCYADTLANRWGKSIWGPTKTTEREYKKGIWSELPKWNERAKQTGKREKVFVMSMGDFFEDHPQVTEWRDKALTLIQACHYLDFQVLTKRPENVVRMIETANSHSFSDAEMWFYNFPNVWIGTSIENQEQASERIPALCDIPARVRFLSCEPLLGPVDIDRLGVFRFDGAVLRSPNLIHWVIVGGESGHGKRPFNPDWARSIRDQCQRAGVPFFMKQMDKVQPIPGDLMIREFPQTVKAA